LRPELIKAGSVAFYAHAKSVLAINVCKKSEGRFPGLWNSGYYNVYYVDC